MNSEQIERAFNTTARLVRDHRREQGESVSLSTSLSVFDTKCAIVSLYGVELKAREVRDLVHTAQSRQQEQTAPTAFNSKYPWQRLEPSVHPSFAPKNKSNTAGARTSVSTSSPRSSVTLVDSSPDRRCSHGGNQSSLPPPSSSANCSNGEANDSCIANVDLATFASVCRLVEERIHFAQTSHLRAHFELLDRRKRGYFVHSDFVRVASAVAPHMCKRWQQEARAEADGASSLSTASAALPVEPTPAQVAPFVAADVHGLGKITFTQFCDSIENY